MFLHQNHIKKTHIFKTFSIICLAIFLSACVKSTPQVVEETMLIHAQKALDHFITSLDNEEKEKKYKEPYSLTGSIRFTSNDKSNRATYLMWANGEHPVRFDLQAGIGSSVAKIMETEDKILFYFPLEEKAISTLPYSALNNLLNLDAPIPLTFLDLSYLCRGVLGAYLTPFVKDDRHVSLGKLVAEHLTFSTKYSKNEEYAFNWQADKNQVANSEQEETIVEETIVETTENIDINNEPINSEEAENATSEDLTVDDLFMSNTPFFTSIILDKKGLPIQYIIQNDWHVSVQYRESDSTNSSQQIPYKITIKSLENDTNIILLIKEHNHTSSYTEEQLTLILPENTKRESYDF